MKPLLLADLSFGLPVLFSKRADDPDPEGVTAVKEITATTVTLYTGHLWDPLVCKIQPDGTIQDPQGETIYLWRLR